MGDSPSRPMHLTSLLSKRLSQFKVENSGWAKAVCPYHKDTKPSFFINLSTGYAHCLAGETEVITEEGVFPIKDLAGKTVKLLTSRFSGRQGYWVDAPIKSYGRQQLWRVELSRNRVRKTVYATKEHRWFIRENKKTKGRTTERLKAGHRLAYVFPTPGRTLKRSGAERMGWVVKSVEPTDRVEEVYCAEVEGTHSFALQDNILTGNCFGCGIKVDLQQLLDRLNIRSIRADHFIKQWGRRKREIRSPNEVNHLPDYILGAYYKCPSRLLKAGFSKELLREHEVGFDTGLYRITFPIRSLDGRLAAVSGRNLQGEPKYQIYTYEEIFPEYSPRPKDHLYNLHKVAGRLEDPSQDSRPLYVVEGFKACLWLVQHGYDAVALTGAQMTRQQKKLLSKYDIQLVLFLDNDSAGRAATVVNYLELSKFQFARVVEYPEDAMQPDDLKGDDLHRALETPKEFRSWYENTDLDTQNMRR